MEYSGLTKLSDIFLVIITSTRDINLANKILYYYSCLLLPYGQLGHIYF